MEKLTPEQMEGVLAGLSAAIGALIAAHPDPQHLLKQMHHSNRWLDSETNASELEEQPIDFAKSTYQDLLELASRAASSAI